MPNSRPRPATSQARLEQVLETSVRLAAEHSLDRVLQLVADSAREVIGARYAALGVLAADGHTLDRFVVSGLEPEDTARLGALPRGHGILGLVIREARTVRLPDLKRHPDSVGFPPGHPVMHSFLGAPIRARSGVFGNLYLTEKEGGGEFTDEDEHLVQLFAVQAAAAVENARLHDESARLLEEVQQLQRARERFFAMVNHELRNALAAVFGWAEMLVRKKDPSTVPPAAFEVLDSADQAIRLINDLLDLSRLDEDRLRPVIQEVDAMAAVRRAVARLTPSAEKKEVRLAMEAPKRSAVTRTDANRLEQILTNLLTNAIRHTPDGSTVQVTITAADGLVAFEVVDAGPGVPDEDLDRIFDIYLTTAEDGRGLGLGLPLSRRLARLLGGELRAVSRSGGGHFRLELPIGE
ncbi:MAG TPA: GAF domain-containing sensor histidine kinase [Gemmatimonadales bacterium]|jgi:signal transduction histidine kinase|nr:GAF domain-containing sensor histidine kinase [Gemmatimonadales bacterium]